MTGSRFVKYLSFAMAIFYMAIGFFIAFTNVLIDRIPYYRPVIGGILLGYGIFRFVKIVIEIRRSMREGKGFFDI
ncbi:MAG TPA: hypothetical protein VD905_17955 [Flavobacteriales bacterium]|nr:hypothetical protein [Flavobacteriales bacterium]